MLVISNGAPKSGSTWLFNILREMQGFAEPPPEFLLDADNVNPEIKYDRLDSLLNTLDFSTQDYLIKNHFGKAEERDLVLSMSNVLVLDISRDLKDVVVSAYHYRSLKYPDFDGSFAYYYWVAGRYLADMVREYHETWRSAGDARVFVASYEALKSDFDGEVQRIAKFLGIDPSELDLEQIRENTSMTSLRDRYGDHGENKFFRKGIVGDWPNYIRGSMLRDINQIEKVGVQGLGFFQKNLGRVLKRYYELRYGTL